MTNIKTFELNDKLERLGVKLPDVLLPAPRIDMNKWAVVACDQYTSQPEYWDEVESIVGDNPSALRITLPEIYLEDLDIESRIHNIDFCMQQYLDRKTVVPQKPGFIFLDRETPYAKSRKGLILTLDLEKYDYNKESQTLIRATENTVIDRLPPRVKIRKNAPIEVPHILVLIDDPHATVIEPIAKAVYGTDSRSEGYKRNIEKIYDFDLMMNGGHIKGYRVNDNQLIEGLAKALETLANPTDFYKKYDVDKEKGVLLFAVGDGNHSLASAKVHWENVKETLSIKEQESHPARYAMVEVINIHDEGLVFEPIHRVLFNVNTKEFIDAMKKYIGKYSSFSINCLTSKEKLDEAMTTEIEMVKEAAIAKKINTAVGKATNKAIEGAKENQTEVKKGYDKGFPMPHLLPFVSHEGYYLAIIEKPFHNLEAASLQEFLDNYILDHPETKIDYIHGSDVVTSIGSKVGNLGFYLPPIDKHQLFKTVIVDGVLPRKTFSMGEAEEKRYYLECRKIVL